MKLSKIGTLQERENAQGTGGQKEKGSQDRTEENLGEIRISVRKLVEFILRHGDIDNRYHAAADHAMQEGSRVHRMIQRRMGAEYQAEVPLKYVLPAEGYVLVVEGRADGIICHKEQVTVDEIKGTYRELVKLREPLPLHLAQAKCYAYMYGIQQGIAQIGVQLTYCNLFTEEQRHFRQDYTMEQLEEWFRSLLDAYQRWADYIWEWRCVRQASIERLEFPFPYRFGQRELAADVYRTIYHRKKLFLEAPTGVGKTLTTIYPAVCAMGRGMGDKLFYLTAKTITRTVAEDALHILRGKGLRMKSVILTAKEKICFTGEAECNPEHCPYARGHYDRINDAVYALLTSQESFSRERIEAYAKRYQVCPFEMCLDMSLFADMVICDYNYLFDPHVYLKRFFGEGGEGKGTKGNPSQEKNAKTSGSSGNYIFLIDEAHNLLERGREMYSASLRKEQFLKLQREIKQTVVSEMNVTGKKADISGQISFGSEGEMTLVLTNMSQTEGEPSGIVSGGESGEAEEEREEAEEEEDWEDMEADPEGRGAGSGRGSSVLVKQGYADKIAGQLKRCNRELLALKRECGQCRVVESLEEFVQVLMRLHAAMEDYLSEQEETQPAVRETLLDFYFDVSHFLLVYDLMDENYVRYVQPGGDGSFLVKLLCVNPRENLKRCMLRGRSTILFSATFLPIQYYKKLLGGDREDYEVYAQSVFDPAKRALLIASDVTSRYARRSQEEYDKIARYIEEIVKNRHGNYMVFCPSYAFLRTVYEVYVDRFAGEGRVCIIQGESMSESDREEFLAKFREGGEGRNRTDINLSGSTEDMEPDGETCGIEEGMEPGGEICGIEEGMEPGGEPGRMEEREDERILIGFCVLGGIFGEGIDLKRDSLIGAVIVGTGLPLVCEEREILRSCFDEKGEDGFDYSYRYPGMNKVLQAAGRVIRTVDDVGIIALLDERFLQASYRRLFPREWEHYEAVTVETVAKRVERFWDEWL